MPVPIPEDGLLGLAPVAERPPFGTVENEQNQHAPGFLEGAAFGLAIVEFDDQGRCHDRAQMDGVASRMDALTRDGQDVIVLVFVHGWKHDARTDDENLSWFRTVLRWTVAFEKTGNAQPRPVLGIFVGWRGMSKFGLGEVIENTTFWDRQKAGQRVAVGSVRELFGRLRLYRSARKAAGGHPLLAIAGHSFGGMIVFSALAQSLIEAASTPSDEAVPSFADLVLLVNPAIEGTRYLPIYDLVTGDAFRRRSQPQLPVFACIQAENDEPVGTFFPIGNAAQRLEQAVKDAFEEQALTHALGFVQAYRTHTLTAGVAGAEFTLDPPEMEQENPFWVVGAAKEIVDGHGGIWGRPFLRFLASLVFVRMQASARPKVLRRARRDEAAGRRHLADVARELPPLDP